MTYEREMSGGYAVRAMGKMEESVRTSSNVIYSRLFIADEILKLDVLPRWRKATADFREGRDVDKFVNEFDSLMNDIKDEAKKSFFEV